MGDLNIRRAKEYDIPVINKLLYEVHKVHSDVRPDLFKAGAKKYSDDELRKFLKMTGDRYLLRKRTELFPVRILHTSAKQRRKYDGCKNTVY